MPQLQNLVLADRETTPVNHTFTPLDIKDGVGTVAESSGVPIGNNTYSVSLRKTPQGRYKAAIKGVFPIVQTQTVNGVSTPVVVRSTFVDMTFSFDASSTEQERKNAVGMIADSLGSGKVLVNDLLTKLQGVY